MLPPGRGPPGPSDPPDGGRGGAGASASAIPRSICPRGLAPADPARLARDIPPAVRSFPADDAHLDRRAFDLADLDAQRLTSLAQVEAEGQGVQSRFQIQFHLLANL